MRAEFTPNLIVDATNATLGRLASYLAKQSLLGKIIAVVNCEEAVITGRKRNIIEEYYEMRQRGGSSQKGPNYPKSPEGIVKRAVRGMLSYKQGRGRDALKRIRCYNDLPVQYSDSPKIKAGKEKNTNFITLKNLSKEL